MKSRVIKKADYIESNWSGGKTSEMAIFPEGSSYLERNFIWRLSTSKCDVKEASLAKMPEFNRTLMLLDGQVVLSHGDERSIKLNSGEQDSFSGSTKTTAFGAFEKEYSLIAKEGCKGSLEILELSGEAIHYNSLGGSVGVYVVAGYAVINIGGESKMVSEGEQFVVDCEPMEHCEIIIMGEGRSILAKMEYDIDEFIMPEIPEEKASTSDFKMAFNLYVRNNRWSNIMRNRRSEFSGQWKSPKLEKAMKRLDKFGVTSIIWCIELVAAFAMVAFGISVGMAGIIALALTVLHIFVIAPLIYVIVLPKPISAHLKDVKDLNPAEMKDFQRQINENERLDKLMAKYRNKDGEYFSDENSPLYKFRMKR